LIHTVGDLKNILSRVAPVNGDFNIFRGFAPKPLNDLNKTIVEAKLQYFMCLKRLI
jgi:hypothetical protein